MADENGFDPEAHQRKVTRLRRTWGAASVFAIVGDLVCGLILWDLDLRPAAVAWFLAAAIAVLYTYTVRSLTHLNDLMRDWHFDFVDREIERARATALQWIEETEEPDV